MIVNYDSVTIDEAGITIKASISENAPNVYFNKLYLYTQDGYKNKVAYTYDITQGGKTNTKSINIKINKETMDIDYSNNLFIISITTSGNYTGNVETIKESYDTGVYDNKKFHDYFYNRIQELKDCKNPIGLIDSYLRYKSLDICIENNDLSKACTLYKHFITKEDESTKCKECCRR